MTFSAVWASLLAVVDSSFVGAALYIHPVMHSHNTLNNILAFRHDQDQDVFFPPIINSKIFSDLLSILVLIPRIIIHWRVNTDMITY